MGPVDASTRKLSILEPLELRHLPAEGLIFDESLPIAWLRAGLGETTDADQPIQILNAGHARITVRPVGETAERPPILIQGRVDAKVQTPCVRCLSDVLLDLGDDVETTLFPSKKESPKKLSKVDEKKAAREAKKSTKGGKKNKKDESLVEDWSQEEVLAIEALDELSYDGETIDVASILEEAVVLAMDLNPCCADEPACDQRTQALLDGVNAASEQAETGPDPRWAALQDMINPESQDS